MNSLKINKIFLLILSVFCFFSVFSNIKAKETEFYSEEVGTNTVQQMQEKWISNNPRNGIIRYTKDGESDEKKFMYWSNYYTDNLPGSDTRGLAPGETLTISINDLNNTLSQEKISEYQDIRLSFVYMSEDLTKNVVKANSLEVYINGNIGPYYIDYYEPTGFYYRESQNKYGREYSVVTENLKDKFNGTINSIRIVPFGNYPMRCSGTGSWRCSEGSLFAISEIKITGYSDTYKKPSYVNTKKLTDSEVNEMRIDVLHNMYDLATIKWSPFNNMNALAYIGGQWRYISQIIEDKDTPGKMYTYSKNNYYYGVPYTQGNRATVERFSTYLDEYKKYIFLTNDDNTQSFETLGDDCASSVYNSLSKYMPYLFVIDTADYARNLYHAKLLGGLPNNTKEQIDTNEMYNELYEDYLNKINNNTLEPEVLESITKTMSQRIKSNDKRMWYLSIKHDDDQTENKTKSALGYTESASTTEKPAIDDNEPLKLYVENIKLQGGKEAKVKFKYYISKSNNGKTVDENLNKDTVIVKFCTSTNCAKGAITLSTVENVNDKYSLQEVEATYTPISNIIRVEIYPYGIEGTQKKNRVFRLADLTISVEGKKNYRNQMDEIFDFQTNKSSDGLINQELISFINDDVDNINLKNQIFARFLARQEIYKGYKELRIGDVFVHYITNDNSLNHVALVSGNARVVCADGTKLNNTSSSVPTVVGDCNSHGGIDPYESYFIRTDISSKYLDNTITNDYLFEDNNDVVASDTWVPNSKYTDLNSITDLNEDSKYTTFRINVKETFKDALDLWYVPATLQVYEKKEVDTPYARIDNPNSIENIKNGLKGTILSNYPIESINFTIKNNDAANVNDKIKTYKIYPNHSTDAVEKNYYGIYSLYYNLPNDNNEINRILNNLSNDYEVIITVDAGTSKEMEVLHLGTQTHTVSFETNGGSSIESQTVLLGSKVEKPSNPTRKGYEFKGWYMDSELTKGYDFNEAVTDDMTLYASWVPYSFKIRKYINLKGETEEYIDTEEVYAYNTKIPAIEAPTKEGYEFKEWYKDSELTERYDFSKTLEANGVSVIAGTNKIGLYAKWEEPYRIEKYIVDDNNISHILEKTELNIFKSNIPLGQGYTVEVQTKKLEDKDVIYTGGKTIIKKGESVYKEFTNIVTGDINGDGKIDSADLLAVKRHLLNKNILTGVYYIAADVNYADGINSTDLLRIKQHLLGKREIV